MRRIFLLSALLVIIGGIFVTVWYTRESPDAVQRIHLGEKIQSVARILYHRHDQSLLLAVQENDNQRSIWKRDAHGTLQRILTHNALEGDIFLSETRDGILFAWFNNPAKLYRSDDTGTTWILTAEGLVFWTITESDDGTLYAPLWEYNTATLYRSIDKGVTWQLWKDFQKLFSEYAVPYDTQDERYQLRHLHDVIAHDGVILVGTGDVARFTFRSTDDGTTWEKIWTEGPTAHTFLTDRTVLMGPDKSKGQGIALYDFAAKKLTETWNPSASGYASYTYSMGTVDGIAYVGLHNEPNSHADIHPLYGIIASPDGTSWYPLITRGPVKNSQYTSVYLTFGEKRIYASIDGELYSVPPISHEWFKQHAKI